MDTRLFLWCLKSYLRPPSDIYEEQRLRIFKEYYERNLLSSITDDVKVCSGSNGIAFSHFSGEQVL